MDKSTLNSSLVAYPLSQQRIPAQQQQLLPSPLAKVGRSAVF